MPAYLTSANLPYGSRVLTIDSVAYVASNFRIDKPTALIERQNEIGEPSGAVMITEARTGSAQLQLALSTTAIPDNGDEFTVDTIVYFITSVGTPEEARAFKVVDIAFRQKI